MGLLHAGHMSLVDRAQAECGAVAVSIFVNPTQFAPTEDLASYPRNVPGDLAILEAAGVDLAFLPEVAEIYPPHSDTGVIIGALGTMLEGVSRPGHFNGVATVVTKLFNIVQPDRAYFGQKDAQQCAVVRRMVRDLNQPVQIVTGATLREADGLAMSSRNVNLTPEQRQVAPVVYRALSEARRAFDDGERRADVLRAVMRAAIAAEPSAELDYVSVADADTLAELTIVPASALALLAVRVGRTRLIDNIQLGDPA